MSTWPTGGRLRRPGRGPSKTLTPQPIHLSRAPACSNNRDQLSSTTEGCSPTSMTWWPGLYAI